MLLKMKLDSLDLLLGSKKSPTWISPRNDDLRCSGQPKRFELQPASRVPATPNPKCVGFPIGISEFFPARSKKLGNIHKFQEKFLLREQRLEYNARANCISVNVKQEYRIDFLRSS